LKTNDSSSLSPLAARLQN